MYSAMAKSAPAGGPKVMDVGIYKRGEAGEGIVTSVNQVSRATAREPSSDILGGDSLKLFSELRLE